MPRLNESNTIDEIERLLMASYGDRIQHIFIDELAEQFASTEADTILEAVRRHISDTTAPTDRSTPFGHYPPSIAQLWTWVDRINLERKRKESQAAVDRAVYAFDGTTVEVPAEVQASYDLPSKRTSYQPRCHDCGDTGIARFWHDPKDTHQVWTRDEYLTLSRSAADALSIAQAICTCPAGMAHPNRALMCCVPVRGQERRMSTWPRLEIIRQLSEVRQNRVGDNWHDNQ